MKKVLLALVFCLVTSLAFADVTAEVLAYDADDNGNIRIKTQYKIDGVEVISRYPTLNDKYYWVTRYSAFNFAGMNDIEIKTRIIEDIEAFSKSLIQKTYLTKTNAEIIKSNLSTLIGTKNTETIGSILVDTNGDKILDTEWVVKTDGTKTEIPYTPVLTPQLEFNSTGIRLDSRR